MKVIALFLWLALPLGVYAAYQTYGTPHFIWSYTFHDNGDRQNPFANRYYTSCTYVGWRWHRSVQPARGGKCPWVRLIKMLDQ